MFSIAGFACSCRFDVCQFDFAGGFCCCLNLVWVVGELDICLICLVASYCLILVVYVVVFVCRLLLCLGDVIWYLCLVFGFPFDFLMCL